MRTDHVTNIGPLLEALDDANEGFEPPPHLKELITEALDATAHPIDVHFMELQRLGQLSDLEDILAEAIEAQVRLCRNVLGASWSEIGTNLGGMTRQAARQRFDRNSATTRADLLEIRGEVLLGELQLELARVKQREAGGELDADEVKAITSDLANTYLEALTKLAAERNAIDEPTTSRTKTPSGK